MKASLAALIRLQTWRCEDARRSVIAAQAEMAALDDRQRRLAAALDEERATARTLSAHAVLDMTAYERRVASEREAIAAAHVSAEAALGEARGILARALGERRKLELAEADRQKARLREEDRRQRAALDEIALQTHARKETIRVG